MKVILRVSDEGYFESIWWRLFQKCIVPTKYDIYVFIEVNSTNIYDHLELVDDYELCIS
jgi:hypothetical protein